jgi:arylsulfatase A-like enzyme
LGLFIVDFGPELGRFPDLDQMLPSVMEVQSQARTARQGLVKRPIDESKGGKPGGSRHRCQWQSLWFRVRRCASLVDQKHAIVEEEGEEMIRGNPVWARGGEFVDWLRVAGARGGRLLALGLALGALALYGQTRPNILFLFADDQRADAIGAWGNQHIRTPNLDRLVQQGFSFRRNYCLGSNGGAVCVPSRAMLNSGKAYFRIPSDLEGVPLLSEMLREAGYVTFATGKWHNGEKSFLRAFPQAKSIFLGGMADHTQVPLHDAEQGQLVNERTGEKFSSEIFADAAVEFLSSYRGKQPFYAYVAFTAPHDPRQPPVPYREMYYKDPPPLPRNFLPQHPFDNGALIGRDENLGPWPRPRAMIQDQLSEYYGMITHLDRQIGRVLEALENSGRAENTIIVYAADHGLAVGSHGLLGKQSIYEHSMKAPLIFAGPGVPQGKSSGAFTYLLDIFPTLATLAGANPPRGLDGYDLSPLWRGEKASVRNSLFLAYQDLMRAALSGGWKLIRYPHLNYTQLFDLENDPDEMHNRAADPSERERVASLMTLLGDWQRSFGDTLPLSVDDPRPLNVDLTGHERPPDGWQPDWIVEKYFELRR